MARERHPDLRRASNDVERCTRSIGMGTYQQSWFDHGSDGRSRTYESGLVVTEAWNVNTDPALLEPMAEACRKLPRVTVVTTHTDPRPKHRARRPWIEVRRDWQAVAP